MRKIGLFTDLHIGLENSSSFFHKENLKLAGWIATEFKKRKIKDVFVLGDVFHNRKQINLESIDNAYQFFKLLKDFRLHILTGNHDCFYLDNSSVHSLSLFKEWDNITVYDTPYVIDEFDISMNPWGTDVQSIPSARYVFGHFEVMGFEMQGTLCEKGLKGSELVDKATETVFSGHFHKPQVKAYGDRSIVYLGSPYQHNFGEINQDKFIYTLDVDTGHLETVVNNISPKHYYVKQTETDFRKYADQIIRPIITDTDTQDEFMLKLQSVSPSYIKEAEIRIDDGIKVSETIEEFQMTVFNDDVRAFVGTIEIDDELKNDVIDITIELYDEVK